MKVKLNIFKLMKTKTRKKKLIRKYKTIITLLGSHLTQRSWTKKSIQSCHILRVFLYMCINLSLLKYAAAPVYRSLKPQM